MLAVKALAAVATCPNSKAPRRDYRVALAADGTLDRKVWAELRATWRFGLGERRSARHARRWRCLSFRIKPTRPGTARP